jgi:hypothetical protein
MQLLAEGTNWYYHKYLDTLDKRQSPLSDVTTQEMYMFFAIIVQVGHNQKDTLEDYWSTSKQFYKGHFGNTKKQDNILSCIHISTV